MYAPRIASTLEHTYTLYTIAAHVYTYIDTYGLCVQVCAVSTEDKDGHSENDGAKKKKNTSLNDVGKKRAVVYSITLQYCARYNIKRITRAVT